MDLETLKLFTMYTVCVCTCLCRANRGGNRAGKRVIVFRNFDDITQLIYNSELFRGRAETAYRVKTCEIIVIVFFLSRFLVGVVVL
jgi:hypothetical protein